MTESGPSCPPPCPPWLRPDTHAAMQAAFEREMAAGRGPTVAAAAACAVLLASVEAASGRASPVEAEGVPGGRATASGAAAPTGEPTPRSMDEGVVAEFVAALAYALRYDARGKPRRDGRDFTADLAAEWLAEQVVRSNFVLSRRRPGAPHRAG